jgi:hypothetical protein
MTTEEMVQTVNSLKAGDRVELVFVDNNFGGDLQGTLMFVVAMCEPMGDALNIDEMSYWNLVAVAQSGKWHGFTKYIATICEGFDAKYFASRTVHRQMLESIKKVA